MANLSFCRWVVGWCIDFFSCCLRLARTTASLAQHSLLVWIWLRSARFCPGLPWEAFGFPTIIVVFWTGCFCRRWIAADARSSYLDWLFLLAWILTRFRILASALSSSGPGHALSMDVLWRHCLRFMVTYTLVSEH